MAEHLNQLQRKLVKKRTNMTVSGNQYILGHPVTHSKSPAMYNAVYKAANLPWTYGFMDCVDDARAREFLQKADFLSINITTPYKPLALLMSNISDANSNLAQGANLLVNTIKNGAPYLRAYNVDGMGCVLYLERSGVQLNDKSVVICGTGPTAMSILHAVLNAGATVTLLGRDAHRAHDAVIRYCHEVTKNAGEDTSVKNRLKAGSYSENASAIKEAEIIIDATSLGMHEGDPAPFDTSLINSNHVVFDTVYGHGTTALVAAASAAGAKTMDGSGMLVGQAVETLQIVTALFDVSLPFGRERIFEIMAHAANFDI